MPVHATLTFETDLQREIYEYVERHGDVTLDELARSVRIEDGPPQSKPARSGTYAQRVRPPMERLREALGALENDGYLAVENGTIRVALAATPTDHDLEGGAIRIRPAREVDRDGLIGTMRAVASEGPYVVAENVAARIRRESALVRVNADRSRVFFVAVRDPGDEDESNEAGPDESSEAGPDESNASGLDDPNPEVVGWLHVDAPTMPALEHTAEVTVGVDPGSRREGIGSHLLEYGLEWAADVGYRKITQSIPATNEEAIEFLEANGWTTEGVREEQYRIGDEYVDEVQLATWLDED